RKPVAGPARRHFDGDQIAVLRVAAGAARDRNLTAGLLLVDRREPPAAVRQCAENAEHARLGAIDDLDDPPAMPDGLVAISALLDPEERAIANACNLGRPRAARGQHTDPRRWAVRVLVPFGRDRDEFAVAIARLYVGENDLRQRSGLVELFPTPPLDVALFRKLLQHMLERPPVSILQAEGAGNLAGADFAGRSAGDEGEDILFGKPGCGGRRG